MVKKIFLYGVFFLSACSQSPEPSSHGKADLTKAPLVPKQVLRTPIKEASMKHGDTVSINGHRFKIQGQEIRLGQRVMDMNMNSSATATGSFFIKNSQELSVLKEKLEVTKVYGHGIAIRALDRNEDLLNVYIRLVKKYGAENVEMSLFYSKPSKRDVQ